MLKIPNQAEEHPSTSSIEAKGSVLYIGHLPHGFYEVQLRGFFSQFGSVKRVRVSRSKKNGNSKHYAFLEFHTPEVAAIAAEAMDGYMLFTQKLVCHTMEPSQIHETLWKGANRKFKKIPWRNIEAERHNRVRNEEQQAQRMARAAVRDERRNKQLIDLGIDYTYKTISDIVSEENSFVEHSSQGQEDTASHGKKRKRKGSLKATESMLQAGSLDKKNGGKKSEKSTKSKTRLADKKNATKNKNITVAKQNSC